MISRNQTIPQELSLEFLMEVISFLDTTFNPLNKYILPVMLLILNFVTYYHHIDLNIYF